MISTVGYYVHHQGAGHRRRYELIRNAMPADIEVSPISELELGRGLRLHADAPSNGLDPTASDALHWAPVRDQGITGRSKAIVDWLHHHDPIGVVVDVSVEATLLCRLASIETVVVRMHGNRTDLAHQIAYRSARRLLAPYPEEFEHAMTPDWVTDKTTFTGFIAPPRQQPGPDDPAMAPEPDDLVVLWGDGGGRLTHRLLDTLLHAAHPHRVWCIGRPQWFATVDSPAVEYVGWVDAPDRYLRSRPTVIASAGNNVVAQVAASRCPLVVIPQARPFDEQLRHAEALRSARAAAVLGANSSESEVRCALDVARCCRDRLGRLANGDGARLAARLISDEFGLVQGG